MHVLVTFGQVCRCRIIFSDAIFNASQGSSSLVMNLCWTSSESKNPDKTYLFIRISRLIQCTYSTRYKGHQYYTNCKVFHPSNEKRDRLITKKVFEKKS